MPFLRDELSRVGGSGDSRAMFSYSSIESISTMTAADYFLPAADELQVGDIIWLVDIVIGSVAISFVTSNTGTSVDLASGTTIAEV
tara:strand:+ start:3414 stop:3671 length:258 start_codon:yes stop_codon:yes gene_type:complete